MANDDENNIDYNQASIDDFLGGLAPNWFGEEYNRYGNANMASDMHDVSIMNPGYITQGPALESSFTPSEPIRASLDRVTDEDESYAVADGKLYQISPTGINFTESYSGDEALDIEEYLGDIYFSYKDGGDITIGRYEPEDEEMTEDWKSPLAGDYGTMEAGGGALYFAFGHTVGRLAGDEFDAAALELPENCEILDLKWSQNRLWIAVNSPDKPGKTNASIYIWDGWSYAATSEISISGHMGGFFLNNGVIYILYEDNAKESILGLIDGETIKPLAKFEGEIPDKHKITNYKSFVIFSSDDIIYSFGAPDLDIDSSLSKFTSGTDIEVITNPFGDPLIITDNGLDVKEFSGYKTDGYWRSLMFNMATFDRLYHNQSLTVYHGDLQGTDKSCEIKIINSNGKEEWSATIDSTTDQDGMSSFTPEIATRETCFEIDFSNSDSSEPIKIMNMYLKGKSDK